MSSFRVATIVVALVAIASLLGVARPGWASVVIGPPGSQVQPGEIFSVDLKVDGHDVVKIDLTLQLGDFLVLLDLTGLNDPDAVRTRPNIPSSGAVRMAGQSPTPFGELALLFSATAVGTVQLSIVGTYTTSTGGSIDVASSGAVAVVPLPASIVLLASAVGGLGALAAARRRGRRAGQAVSVD